MDEVYRKGLGGEGGVIYIQGSDKRGRSLTWCGILEWTEKMTRPCSWAVGSYSQGSPCQWWLAPAPLQGKGPHSHLQRMTSGGGGLGMS